MTFESLRGDKTCLGAHFDRMAELGFISNSEAGGHQL
jgi:hypothetical protein